MLITKIDGTQIEVPELIEPMCRHETILAAEVYDDFELRFECNNCGRRFTDHQMWLLNTRSNSDT